MKIKSSISRRVWLATHRRGVHAAAVLAATVIPSDMVEFLERWPVAFDAAKRDGKRQSAARRR
jgi:hypothetical protein